MYADIISEFSVSRYVETRGLDFAAVNEALAMVDSRRSVLARSRRYRPRLDPHRVPGGRSLPAAGLGVGYSTRWLASSEADVRALEQTFHDTHRRVFAVDEPGQYLECLVWKSRATAVTAKPSVSARAVESAAGDLVDAPAFFRNLV